MNAFTEKLLNTNGTRSPRSLHQELGRIMWEKCGMSRSKAGLDKALQEISALRDEFVNNLNVSGNGKSLNQELERAGRLSEFIDLAELMCHDALDRDESCGGHFREEHQTEDGEAVRQDDKFSHTAVWEFTGSGTKPKRHTEELSFNDVKLAVRSYK